MPLIATIDVETTGFNWSFHDRIVEVAAVVMRPNGEVVREFVTLVNPCRDIGPTQKHGITSEDVIAAPQFGEVAGALVEVLDGCTAVAGHNVLFDHSFLCAEFERLNHLLAKPPLFCTMRMAGGGKLSVCCQDYGVTFTGDMHSALHDARASARLLSILLADAPEASREIERLPPIEWPRLERMRVELLTRDDTRQRQAAPPSYLQRLLARANDIFAPENDDAAAVAYSALLDRVLEDRRIEEHEGEALIEAATRWNIGPDAIRDIHRTYLHHLSVAALADGVVTGGERRDLMLVARLLGVDQARLDEMLADAAKRLSDVRTSSPADTTSLRGESLLGKRVCFTGECQCSISGAEITRDMARTLAEERGLVVAESVTKKLDVLVVSDPATQSGKAAKARKYGIRIMHEPSFWNALGIAVE